jgi:hypothetical protein
MLLTVHTIAGAAVGLAVHNPVLSAPIAFATHILLDAVPHWNYPVPKEKSIQGFWQSFGPDMLATILVSVGLIVWFWTVWPLVVWGIAWACLPDFLTLYQKAKPWSQWFKWYYKLHNQAQWEVARGPGLAIQAFFVAILVSILRILK